MNSNEIKQFKDEALDVLRELAAEAELHVKIVTEKVDGELAEEARLHARRIQEKVREVDRLVRVLARDTTFGHPPAPS